MSQPHLEDDVKPSNNPPNSSIVEPNLDTSRLRSHVWRHYKRQKISNGQIKAICNYCKSHLNVGPYDGTTHLQSHLNRCQRSKLVQTDIKQYQLVKSKRDNGKDAVASYVFDQNFETKTLAHMIIMHEYPLSMVEHEAFREFSTALQLAFKPVSRNTIKKEILQIYDVEKMKTISILQANNCRIALTTDLWTASSQRKGYMAVTTHVVDESWCLQSRILRLSLSYWLTFESEVIRKMAENMIRKHEHYWGVLHGVMDVASILDPRSKKQVELMSIFDAYVNETNPTSRSELDAYLEENILPNTLDFDILTWWKANGSKYPILARVARDVLVIPVSTVASKPAFSTGGRVVVRIAVICILTHGSIDVYSKLVMG
ncbi:hypothetical protein Dsin_018489 [Dipteronia sinensis]|uniref:BED-type domain-containing protein n=1 Tax=Dipteronia sinensis TaxID=43782 RepID=A0AAE0A6Y8_9ROSI|nr:hypothetical protein Dsin_018489 [Dipteronia sinensis]